MGLLRAELRDVQAERDRLRQKYRRADRPRQQLVRRLTDERGPVPAQAFADPDEQFREEVRAEWVQRIAAADKAARPLKLLRLADTFLPSLAALDGDHRRKVVQVACEVACGLSRDLAGREDHSLRTSRSGGTGRRTRVDGAVGRRVALQQGAPSARRLHYWVLPDGGIELTRVGVHDDLRD